MKRKREKPLEIRMDPSGALDEVVVHTPTLVHFERMSDQSIWCGVNFGKGELVRIWISSKNGRAHVSFSAEVEPKEKA